MAETLLDLNRRDINLSQSKVKEVLPSYYTTDYPNLVKFLEYYYDWMDSDTNHGFTKNINDLYKIRDLQSTDLKLLNQIFYEIGDVAVNADYFLNPRLAANLIANFYRIKGSLYSAEGFFRAFYGEQPEIVYPKNNLFIVGDSRIGPESLKYIQNGALYQVLSILVRSGQPISKWRNLYKIFAHPAGFYLGGEVAIESVTNLNLSVMPNVIADSSSGLVIFENFGTILPQAITSITLVVPDGGDADSISERLVPDTIRMYQALTIQQLNRSYNDIEDWLSPNSPTFDAESDGSLKIIKFSSAIETMDEDRFE
jgi:hypothetical protein